MTSTPQAMTEQCSSCHTDLDEGQIGLCDDCIELGAATQLTAIRADQGAKSISDDDLCSACVQCQRGLNDLSRCSASWPGLEDADGYVLKCLEFVPTQV